MGMVNFKIEIADIVVEINAFNESTLKYCSGFLSDKESNYVMTMTKEDLENEKHINEDGKVYANEEISALYRKIADIFVEENILVMHGSSFKVDNSAFIVTARSGVGKSTHVNLLKQYLKDRFTYINDDKPLLKIKGDKLTLYSSPWNGKERRGNNINAPLRSIIFLNRGISNTYKKLDNKEVYFRLLSQIYLPLDKTKREKALKLIDILLKSVSFYEINVNTDISSAEMTSERIINYEIK